MPSHDPLLHPESPLAQGEKTVLDWVNTHPIPNKDAALEHSSPAPRAVSKNRKGSRHPSSWDLPLPDLEVDLHHHTVDEALAVIDETLISMEKAHLYCLRIVHGGGHPGYGLIKKALDRQFRTVWRHRMERFVTEPQNVGSSLVILPRSNSPTTKRTPKR